MTDQTSTPTIPSAAPQSKSRLRWLKITLGIIVAAVLLLRLIGSVNSLDLELTRRDLFDAARDGKVLDITNTGSKPLKLTKIVINDRSDCTVAYLSLAATSLTLPLTVKVGDQLSLVSNCRVVRVAIDTDQGSNTYSFNR